MTGPNTPDDPQYPHNDPNQGAGQPGYPGGQGGYQGGYPAGYPGYPPPASQPPQPPQPPVQTPGMLWSSMVRNLGDRALRRARPRLGVALAGAGVALAIIGVLVWSGTYLIEGIAGSAFSGGGGPSDSRKWLGVVLSLVVVAEGYVLAVRRPSGPLSAAGVAASALGVPMLMLFLTFSLSSDPVSIDAIALVSILVWLVSYAFIPGTRGHVFYLALSAVTLYGYVLDKIEPNGFSGVAVSQVNSRFGFLGAGSAATDPATITGVSLVFGIAYYTIAFALDRSGHPGVGVAFIYSAFGATVAGIISSVQDFKQVGTGVELIIIGAVVAVFAARSERRFTTWVWSAAVALGLALILGKATGSDHTVLLGILFIVFGAGLVVAAALVTSVLREPDELTPSPSGAVH